MPFSLFADVMNRESDILIMVRCVTTALTSACTYDTVASLVFESPDKCENNKKGRDAVFNSHRVPLLIFLLLFLISGCDGNKSKSAKKPESEPKDLRMGAFEFTTPVGWNVLRGRQLAQARGQFASGIDLRRYRSFAAFPPHMDDFIILQKPNEAQVMAWTLRIPDRLYFTNTMLETEQKTMKKQLKKLVSGEVKLATIDEQSVIRVNVVLGNKADSTNLHFWSPKHPGRVTTLMIGSRPTSSQKTKDEMTAIINSVHINDTIVDKPQDPDEPIFKEVVNRYLKAMDTSDLDEQIAVLHPRSSLRPNDRSIERFRKRQPGVVNPNPTRRRVGGQLFDLKKNERSVSFFAPVNLHLSATDKRKAIDAKVYYRCSLMKFKDEWRFLFLTKKW